MQQRCDKGRKTGQREDRSTGVGRAPAAERGATDVRTLLGPDVVEGLRPDGAAAHGPGDVLGEAFPVLSEVVGGV